MSNRIAMIEAFEVSVPLPQPLELGAISITRREYVLVRIRDDEGRCGNAVGLSRNAPVAETVVRTIASRLTGRLFEDYDDHYNTIVKENAPLGTNGIFWRALSLVDCAVYDLLAQRSGKPLFAYLNGRQRPVPCALVGGYPLSTETPASLQDQALEMEKLNAAVIKIGSCGDFARDTERLATIRDAVPQGPPLAIDLYWQCPSHKKLLVAAKQWERLNMAWIEDPFAFDDYASTSKLSEQLSYAVGIGDEQTGFRNFERLITEGRIGVVRIDATVCGGIRAFLRIASLAADHGLPVSCHLFHQLHAQLACAAPAVKWVEQFLPHAGLDCLHLLLRSEPPLRNGTITGESGCKSIWDWDEKSIDVYRKR